MFETTAKETRQFSAICVLDLHRGVVVVVEANRPKAISARRIENDLQLMIASSGGKVQRKAREAQKTS